MSMIEFGMPTLVELDLLEDNIMLCKELGLAFVEINMNLPQFQLDRMKIKELQYLMLKYKIYYTIHLEEKLSVTDFNQRVANAYLNTIIEAIYLAKELKIPILNMHFDQGVHFKLPDRKVYLYDYYKEEYIEKLRYFRVKCEEAIGEDDIRICIENCDGWKGYEREGIELLLESKAFGLTLDIGHSHCAKGVDEEFFEKYQQKLLHMHIHDATLKTPHLALGTGDIDINKKLKLAKHQNCRCVLETKNVESLRSSVLVIPNCL